MSLGGVVRAELEDLTECGMCPSGLINEGAQTWRKLDSPSESGDLTPESGMNSHAAFLPTDNRGRERPSRHTRAKVPEYDV